MTLLAVMMMCGTPRDYDDEKMMIDLPTPSRADSTHARSSKIFQTRKQETSKAAQSTTRNAHNKNQFFLSTSYQTHDTHRMYNHSNNRFNFLSRFSTRYFKNYYLASTKKSNWRSLSRPQDVKRFFEKILHTKSFHQLSSFSRA